MSKNTSTKNNQKIQVLVNEYINSDYKNENKINSAISLIYPNIKSHIYNILSKSSHYDECAVDDITSDVFIKIHECINQYDTKFMFVTWAYSIARYTTYNYIKIRNKSGVKDNIIIDDIIDDGDLPTDLIYYGHDEDSKIKNFGEIYSVILNLEDSIEKSIFIHKVINGLLVKDISEMYNISQNTVKTKLFNYRKVLSNNIKNNHTSLLNVYLN